MRTTIFILYKIFFVADCNYVLLLKLNKLLKCLFFNKLFVLPNLVVKIDCEKSQFKHSF